MKKIKRKLKEIKLSYDMEICDSLEFFIKNSEISEIDITDIIVKSQELIL